MGKKANVLTLLVLLGLAVGVLVGHFFLWDPNISEALRTEHTQPWRTAGDFVFIRPLKLLIIPLVFTSVLTGIASIGSPQRLGLLGGATLLYYLATMVLAVTLGVTLGAVFKPGAGVPSEALAAAESSAAESVAGIDQSVGGGLGQAWLGILEQLIPDNFFQAATEATALSVITSAMLLGVGLVAVGERGKPFLDVVTSLHEALMRIVQWLLWLMPIGVLCLVAYAVGQIGLSTIAGAVGKYVAVVLGGLGFHAFVTLPLVAWLVGRFNPYKFMWNMRPALITAFGTASSMATLPVTIETAVKDAGSSKRAAGLVLPLGATVNMDGTALYQGTAVIFLFQAYGADLTFAQYLTIVITATLAAIGAAGIPGAGITMMLIVITAVNTTLEGTGLIGIPLASIGLILGVDRLIDMVRTAVNVWGDSLGSRIITRLAPDEDEAKERAYA